MNERKLAVENDDITSINRSAKQVFAKRWICIDSRFKAADLIRSNVKNLQQYVNPLSQIVAQEEDNFQVLAEPIE